METPKDWIEITDEEWKAMETNLKKLKKQPKETLWESFKWEVGYKYRSFTTFLREIKQGFWNLWSWRKIIWRNRWWDYQFLFDIQKKQLCYMRDSWHKGYALHKEYFQKELNELCKILDRIEELEDDFDTNYKEKQKEINNLYQEFGRKLYFTRNITIEETDESGKVHTQKMQCSLFEALWD